MPILFLKNTSMSNKPSSAIKVITVSVFTLLIVCFVCYRVGAFDNFSFASASTVNYYDANNTLMALDTPIVAKDSVVIEREIMPSSKMMVMPKPKKTDTVKKAAPVNNAPPQTDTTKKKPLKKSNIMGSSKSAYIYEPEPDTAVKQKK